MFEYYNSLPDYLSIDELKKHFLTLLDAFENQETYLYDFIESLGQLSDRQWHTYTILDSELKSRIDAVILGILKKEEWSKIDLFIFRITLTIIGNLGLSESYKLLQTSFIHSLDDQKKEDAKRLINQVEKFSGGQIENPYLGM